MYGKDGDLLSHHAIVREWTTCFVWFAYVKKKDIEHRFQPWGLSPLVLSTEI